MNELKEALDKNRVTLKVELRKKWRDSDNATLQMGLMKLIASNEERKSLSQSYHDLTTEGKSINKIYLGGEDETATETEGGN